MQTRVRAQTDHFWDGGAGTNELSAAKNWSTNKVPPNDDITLTASQSWSTVAGPLVCTGQIFRSKQLILQESFESVPISQHFQGSYLGRYRNVGASNIHGIQCRQTYDRRNR